MNRKLLFRIIFFLGLALLFISCGIKDSLFLKAPENLRVYNNRGTVNDLYLAFDAFNQEKEDAAGEYLLVGYELWYYIDNINDAKICNVFFPYDTTNPTSNPTLINLIGETGRFPSGNFTNQYLYQQVSIPVSKTMIDNALSDGNSANVLVYFGDNPINGTMSYDTSTNTFTNSDTKTDPYLNGDTVIFDRAYPVKSDCDILYNYNAFNKEDYQDHFNSSFAGFFTAEYYTYVKGLPAGQSHYTVKFYVTAIGFESDSTRTAGNLQLRSDPSNTVSVDFQVNGDDIIFPDSRS